MMSGLLYIDADGRKKIVEKKILTTVMALWCEHYPWKTLPKDPRQGRIGDTYEFSPVFRLCEVVVEAVTEKRSVGLRKVYESVWRDFQKYGFIASAKP